MAGVRVAGQVGGSGGPVKRAAWAFLCASIVVALWNGLPHAPESVLSGLRAKSGQLEQVVRGWVAALGLSEDGAPPAGVDGDGSGSSTPEPAAGDENGS
jgi:hypothetical protein